MSFDALSDVNAIDILILALVAIAFAGFWPGQGKPHRARMGQAILLLIAGIAALLAQGRFGLIGGGPVLAILLIGNRTSKALGSLGAVASLVAVGYMLLIVWFGWTVRFLLSTTSPGLCALWLTSERLSHSSGSAPLPDSGPLCVHNHCRLVRLRLRRKNWNLVERGFRQPTVTEGQLIHVEFVEVDYRRGTRSLAATMSLTRAVSATTCSTTPPAVTTS